MRLFICNLAWAATDDDLKRWLTTVWGYEVSEAKVIMHNETGRSRGFGFVELPNEEQGQDALLSLPGADFMGRPVKVNLATRKEPPRRQESARRGPPDRRDQSDRSARIKRGRRDDSSSTRRGSRDNDWKW
jgi:RNA recognition motif-containing protein